MVISSDIIWKYFYADLEVQEKFDHLGALYQDLNQKINVISRKDIDSLYIHHILHSLVLKKFDRFHPGAKILDLGTGGGFPGIPLAMMYPDCQFTLIDGTRKKIEVVKTIIQSLQLTNVEAIPVRAEDLTGQFDFVVSRAVASASKIWHWSKHLLPRKTNKNAKQSVPSVFLLKGGDLSEELKDFPFKYTLYPIQLYFEEPYFQEKYILAF
ncbi:MAG: 16S rRNA (guanine(527)-N(7))-methyltransferase RsmG [Saprospiraceae bacterium]|nr:16S rRNA (guanine(527)-N(7))-methyltransferase RsmG [Saprospiraceae bacterium]